MSNFFCSFLVVVSLRGVGGCYYSTWDGSSSASIPFSAPLWNFVKNAGGAEDNDGFIQYVYGNGEPLVFSSDDLGAESSNGAFNIVWLNTMLLRKRVKNCFPEEMVS